jgi:uncharacterized membrane protein
VVRRNAGSVSRAVPRRSGDCGLHPGAGGVDPSGGLITRERLLGIALVLFGLVWWRWLLNQPVDPFVELALGVYLAYRWYAAAGAELGLRPWELAAGLILVLDAIEELLGFERVKEVILVYPGLIFLAGVIYLLDRRALKSQSRTVAAIALTVAGSLSYYHQYGLTPSARIGDIVGILSAIYLFTLWYRARVGAGAAVAWVFAIAAGLFVDSVGRLTGHDLRLLVVALPVAAGLVYLLEPKPPIPAAE